MLIGLEQQAVMKDFFHKFEQLSDTSMIITVGYIASRFTIETTEQQSVKM